MDSAGDSRSSEGKGAPVQLLTSPTGAPTTSPRPRRPVAFDIPDEPIQAFNNVATSSSQPYPRPYSPVQDAASSDPSQRKRVRSSLDANPPSRKRSNIHGSPLNPLNPRHSSLSISGPSKRRAEAFEVNPMYEEGMDIFQDPLRSTPVIDAKVMELQRRARALGPAPLAPSKSQPQPSNGGPSPKTPPVPHVRPSLDANVASMARQRAVSPVAPTSPLAARSPSMRVLSPVPDSYPSPPKPRAETLPHLPTTIPDKDKGSKTSLGHLISDLKRKGKGKEKETDAEAAARLQEAEERIAAIKASPLAHDPMLLQRVKTTADQLGRRYSLMYRSLQTGEPPPNPLDAIRWRNQILEHAHPQKTPRVRQPEARPTAFDLPPMITEDPPVEDLYSASEIESLSWVKCLNTVHLQGLPMRKDAMDWHLTAGVSEAHVVAVKRMKEQQAYDREYGPLHDSPSSGHISLFPARSTSENRVAELRGTGVSPRSSTSVSSGGRAGSGPNQTFKFPFTSPKASLDAGSGSSSSQKSAEVQPSNGHAKPPPPQKGQLEPPLPQTAISKEGSRRSSLDTGFASEEAARSNRRHVRNSLPGIIDSSKNSLTQLLSPLTTSPGQRIAPPRSHTSPRFGPVRTEIPSPSSRKEFFGLRRQGSDSERSSLSDHPLSPVVSTSDDGRKSSHALQKAKRRMMGEALTRRVSEQPPLRELIELEREELPSRTTSLPQPRVTSAEGLEVTTSDDDFSSKRGLGITRAGKKVAKSWNALADRVSKGGLYEDRHNALNATDSSLLSPPPRQPMFRTDTGATERPGTRSDHLLRSGKRYANLQTRSSTLEDDETREARRHQHEEREAAIYDQRSRLVEDSKRQSEAVNHILQIAVRAIADYANRQTALSDSLGLTLEPPLSASLFDLIEPIEPSIQKGWRAVEEDYARKRQRRAQLDAYLRALQPSPRNAQEESKILQGIMDLVPVIWQQVDHTEHALRAMEEEAERIKELQAEIQLDMDEAEALFNRTAERIDTSYPELSRNEELARLLGPDNMTQLLPEWVPDWAQTLLLAVSPIVRFLAETILLTWKHNPFAELLPERWRNLMLQFLLSCVITMWNLTVKTYGAIHYTLQLKMVQGSLHWVGACLLKLKSYPVHSIAFLAASWFLLHFVRSANDRAVASLLMQYS